MQGKSDIQSNRIEALLLCVIFTAISVALFLALDAATRPGRATAGWWTKPAFAPGVALAVLCLANIWTLARYSLSFWHEPATRGEWREARRIILNWWRPLEFLAYFAVYIWALGLIGYTPATLVFVLGLMWRTGLRSARWLMVGAAFALVMTAIFRWGLGVWMPTADLYDALPAPWRNWAIRWF